MLCFAMLGYAVLCFALLCAAMLCYALLCFALLCNAMLSLLQQAWICIVILHLQRRTAHNPFYASSRFALHVSVELRVSWRGWRPQVLSIERQTSAESRMNSYGRSLEFSAYCHFHPHGFLL